MTSRKSRSPASRILAVLPAIARAVAVEVRRAGADVQLTMTQYSALRLLAGHPCSATEVARTLHVSMPTATQSVDSLVGKGLAERFADEEDRRQVRVQITDAGRRVLARCRKAVEAYLVKALSRWPDERQCELAQGLEHMLELVKEARGS